MPDQTTEALDVWAVVELLGHRRTAGRVREIQLAGAGFLRLDIPAGDGQGDLTQFVSPGSVYCLTPVDEPTARAVAAHTRPEPVHRWELPAAPEPVDPPESWALDVDEPEPEGLDEIAAELAAQDPAEAVAECTTCDGRGGIRCLAHIAGDGCVDGLQPCPDCAIGQP